MAEVKQPRDRSPKFPYLTLRDAEEKLGILYTQYKQHPARVTDIAPSWNISKTSGKLLRVIAALKAYGLVEYLGSGKDRKLKITPLGISLVADKRPGAREKALAKALWTPTTMKTYLERWGESPPPKSGRESELTIDDGFTSIAAKRFIKVYDENIALARIDAPAEPGSDDYDDGADDSDYEIEVGSVVQWESQGVLQFQSPKVVRAVTTDDDGETWVFVEDSETGIPMEEVTVMEPAEQTPRTFMPPTMPLPKEPMADATEEFSGKVNKEENRSYELRLIGDWDQDDFGKLIAILEAIKLTK